MVVRKPIISLTVRNLLKKLDFTGELAANRLKGRVVLLRDQATPATRIKLQIFRFDSGVSPDLYPVSESLRFSVALMQDGEYIIDAIVENDECFSTNAVRLAVKNGKIVNNKRIELFFICTQID